jgi:hypothetical protein
MTKRNLVRVTVVTATVAAFAAGGSAAARSPKLDPSASWRNENAQTQRQLPRAHWNGRFRP